MLVVVVTCGMRHQFGVFGGLVSQFLEWLAVEIVWCGPWTLYQIVRCDEMEQRLPSHATIGDCGACSTSSIITKKRWIISSICEKRRTLSSLARI